MQQDKLRHTQLSLEEERRLRAADLQNAAQHLEAMRAVLAHALAEAAEHQAQAASAAQELAASQARAAVLARELRASQDLVSCKCGTCGLG